MAIGNWLTTEDVARELNVSEGRVRQFVTENRIPSQKLGPARVFSAADVRKFARIDRPNGRPRKPRKKTK